MKFTCTVDINQSLEKTVSLWENEANFKEWQDGFESIEHISGTPNTVGAKSKIILSGKRRVELLETIISYDLPNEKTALYEHIHMTNIFTARFKALSENKTQYTCDIEYTKFNGFVIKLMARLFPNMFKKQSQKWLDQFKAFAEKQ